MKLPPRSLSLCLAPALLLAGGALNKAKALDPVDCVNPLSGTDSSGEFSRGNTFPAIVLPFANVMWSPQTDGSSSSFYTFKATKFEGLRATHQPSIWIRDYGEFTVMPVVGDTSGNSAALASDFTHADEKALPYYYSVALPRYKAKAELAPSERGAFMRFTFPTTDQAALVFRNPRGEFNADEAKQRVTGTAKHVTFGAPGNFAMYFVAEFDQPFTKPEPGKEKEGSTLAIHFAAKGNDPVKMRIGTSYISYEQAEANLRREVPDWSFEGVRDRARAAWVKQLGAAEVEGATDAQKSTFYTALYRAVQFPRQFNEIDPSGKVVHYSPYDNGLVHDGPVYTDDGLWDTYRAAFPLLALLYPERDGDIMQGWVNAYKEGGWLPTWPSPGNRPCMIGSHGQSIVADAYFKGIKGFDVNTAYEAVKKDGVKDNTGGWAGRDRLNEYIQYGYVPTDKRKDGSVSVTLEYAYDDYCAGRMAKALGHEEDAKMFLDRARNSYKNVWDKESGFMRGKDSNGTWQSPFDPIAWGGAYVEGNPWQWIWSVQQDPYGLMELLGGREATAKKLDTLLSMGTDFKVGGYGHTIHEMREVVEAKMGQYAHVNEPDHHVLFFYNYAGQPWKTQFNVRRVMDEVYKPTGMLGDEDTGQMSAWYVFNAAGFYPFCPGNPIYLIGSPLFSKISLHMEGGKTFVVKANNNGPTHQYIQSAKLNGQPYTKNWLPHDVVAKGGSLEVEMGSEPNTRWGSAPGDAPPDDMK